MQLRLSMPVYRRFLLTLALLLLCALGGYAQAADGDNAAIKIAEKGASRRSTRPFRSPWAKW